MRKLVTSRTVVVKAVGHHLADACVRALLVASCYLKWGSETSRVDLCRSHADDLVRDAAAGATSPPARSLRQLRPGARERNNNTRSVRSRDVRELRSSMQPTMHAVLPLSEAHVPEAAAARLNGRRAQREEAKRPSPSAQALQSHLVAQPILMACCCGSASSSSSTISAMCLCCPS